MPLGTDNDPHRSGQLHHRTAACWGRIFVVLAELPPAFKPPPSCCNRAWPEQLAVGLGVVGLCSGIFICLCGSYSGYGRFGIVWCGANHDDCLRPGQGRAVKQPPMDGDGTGSGWLGVFAATQRRRAAAGQCCVDGAGRNGLGGVLPAWKICHRSAVSYRRQLSFGGGASVGAEPGHFAWRCRGTCAACGMPACLARSPRGQAMRCGTQCCRASHPPKLPRCS